MSRVVELLCSRRVPHVCGAGADVVWLCRLQRRHVDAPFAKSYSNPFASQPEATGSVPAPLVERRELPQYSRPQYQRNISPRPCRRRFQRRNPIRAAGRGVSGGGRGLASYSPPAHPQLETTGSVAPRSVAAAHGPGQSGTTIIVGTSDTLETLSHRYNVSSAAILQANGYKGPRALSPGQQLIIPRQTAAVAAPALAAPASKTVAALPSAPPRFTSSITAIPCSASPVATTCRWPNWREPTTSNHRRNSSSA